ncbi:MAG: hypothetical protein ABIZ70_00220 [Gemmatimonadales bacterium]
MAKWGFRLTVVGMAWAMLSVTLFIPEVRDLTSNAGIRLTVFILGFIGTTAIIGGWFLAIMDWYQHRPRSGLVGLALVCFNFVAAWAYWLFRRQRSNRKRQQVKLRIANASNGPRKVVVEPWTFEHTLPAGAYLDLHTTGDLRDRLEVECGDAEITVHCLDSAGAEMQVFRDGAEVTMSE